MRQFGATLALLFVLAAFVPGDVFAQQLVYYGGPVVSNAQVVVVSWGSSVETSVQSGMPGFYTAILNSPYLDWLSEYSTAGLTAFDGQAGSNQRIGRGALVGSYTITPSVTATTVTTAQIVTELTAQVAAGKLPAPVSDSQGLSNTIYMVNFPPGITIKDQNGNTSCVQFCGTQDSATINGKTAGVGIIPDVQPTGPCGTGCGTDSVYFNNVTAVHAHILLNIITDLDISIASAVARPLAWYDSAHGAVCDICNQEHAVVAGYTIEKGWSNTLAQCIAETGTPLPVCDGSTTYCRECTAADDNQATGCTGTRATCEVESTNVAFGECVACATSANCSGTTPVCTKGGTSNDTCIACSTDTQCLGNSAGPHCLSSGACGAAVVPDAGSGGGSSKSGCSSTDGAPAGLPMLFALAGLLGLSARRRSRKV